MNAHASFGVALYLKPNAMTGGINNNGVVFQLTPPSAPSGAWGETALYTFQGGTDGAHPNGGLVTRPGGTLFGTTMSGGSLQYGTVFALTPPATDGAPWVESLLHTFGGTDGMSPQGGLLQLSAGQFVGACVEGGFPGGGVIYTLTPPVSHGSPWLEYVLVNFHQSIGEPPSGSLTLLRDLVIGSTNSGGEHDRKTVFELAADGPDPDD